MTQDRGEFFDLARVHPFGGSLTEGQEHGCTAILDAWDEWAPKSDPRWIAYSLGTSFWETARTMQPIRELGLGKGRSYGRPSGNGKVYYGRGLVQLTWEKNYIHADEELRKRKVLVTGESLEDSPDLVLRTDIAAAVLVLGMTEGWFSGRKLGDYFRGTRSDWVDARAIINGKDRAALVGALGLQFYHALQGGV